jgi:hypothetical protein
MSTAGNSRTTASNRTATSRSLLFERCERGDATAEHDDVELTERVNGLCNTRVRCREADGRTHDQYASAFETQCVPHERRFSPM